MSKFKEGDILICKKGAIPNPFFLSLLTMKVIAPMYGYTKDDLLGERIQDMSHTHNGGVWELDPNDWVLKGDKRSIYEDLQESQLKEEIISKERALDRARWKLEDFYRRIL